MRAKCQADRWNKELQITQHEMVWVLNFFTYQKTIWKDRALEAVFQPGHRAYAYKQATMWEEFWIQAHPRFMEVFTGLPDVFGYSSC